MSGKSAKRFYEVKSGDHTELAILPGKNALEFELLHTQVAEEYMPDGLLQEDAVLTIAKCIWRNRQSTLSKVTNTGFDKERNKKAQQALLAFHKVLVEGAPEHKIRHQLGCQQFPWEYFLLRDVQRQDFQSGEAWAEAMANEIKETMLPVIAKFLAEEKEVVGQSEIPEATIDELFDREHRFNERNEAALQRAIDGLLKLKEAKRPISFRASQRFERTHPNRLKVKIAR